MTPDPALTRRSFLGNTGAAVGAGLAPLVLPRPGVFASENNTIRLALIGCGGRGTGAADNALSVTGHAPIHLWAMADLDSRKISSAHDALKKRFPTQVQVPEDRRFLGFEAYKAAIDSLSPGDIALCTTRAYIRPLHVEYAVSRGIHVFMEKPFAPDPAGLKKMLKNGELADQNGVKIAAGLQCRHSPARQALIQRIRDGQLGDIPLVRANRLGGASFLSPQKAEDQTFVHQLQIGRIHLLWVGSGHMVDNLIHQIDECCWLMDAWPESVVGMGGRVPGSTDAGQNLDVYSMEYTFPNGAKAICGFRRMNQCRNEFATFVHGTKSAAQFSGNVHAATVHQYRDQRIQGDQIAWTPEKDAKSPWQYEWDEFIRSICTDRPHNECQRAVFADIASLMGRAACHTGQKITWEQVAGSDFSFTGALDQLTMESPPPFFPDDQGNFPVPIPRKWKEC